MANARTRDFFAQVQCIPGLKPQTLTENTYANAAVFDRIDCHGAQVMFPVALTTAAGGADGTVVLEIEVATDVAADGAFATIIKTVDLPLLVGTADGAQALLGVLPVKLLKADQFVRVRARVKKTGTITLSAIVGALTIETAQNFSNPSSTYDGDGYLA